MALPADDPTSSPAYQGSYGHTDYYLFETPDLPLFGPLRTLGVPEPVIDVFEPFFKVIVDAGYDRNIKPWEPTPARLIPPLNPEKTAGDLVEAIGEGVTNARKPRSGRRRRSKARRDHLTPTRHGTSARGRSGGRDDDNE